MGTHKGKGSGRMRKQQELRNARSMNNHMKHKELKERPISSDGLDKWKNKKIEDKLSSIGIRFPRASRIIEKMFKRREIEGE